MNIILICIYFIHGQIDYVYQVNPQIYEGQVKDNNKLHLENKGDIFYLENSKLKEK